MPTQNFLPCVLQSQSHYRITI